MKVLSVAPDNDGCVNITWPFGQPNVTVLAVELRLFRAKMGKPWCGEHECAVLRRRRMWRLTVTFVCTVMGGGVGYVAKMFAPILKMD